MRRCIKCKDYCCYFVWERKVFKCSTNDSFCFFSCHTLGGFSRESCTLFDKNAGYSRKLLLLLADFQTLCFGVIKHLHTSLGSMPLVSTGPHPFSLLQPSLFAAPGLGRFPGQAHAQVPGPFIPYMHPGPYSLPQAGLQPRLRPYVPSQSLPFSNAVWRKSAAQSANSRIVWEHTRGRYNCMQCPYSGMSREEITSHVQEHGKGLPNCCAQLATAFCPQSTQSHHFAVYSVKCSETSQPPDEALYQIIES
uniref:C2H2-type domain-containing protein n=1 Tax=Callorhinchus milii TaxID=7868 RepID=A0A4W3JWN5_CALMI